MSTYDIVWWRYPCHHAVEAPQGFSPSEFCPVCKDSRGPEPITDFPKGILELNHDSDGVEEFRRYWKEEMNNA